MADQEVEPRFEGTFYEAVGRALTEWSRIEDRLSWLFGACIDFRFGDGGHAAASAGLSTSIFFAVDGMPARLKMIDGVMGRIMIHASHGTEDQKKGQEFLLRWDETKRRLKGLTDRRNRIAHWNVYVTADDNGQRVPFLTRTLSDPGRTKC